MPNDVFIPLLSILEEIVAAQKEFAQKLYAIEETFLQKPEYRNYKQFLNALLSGHGSEDRAFSQVAHIQSAIEDLRKKLTQENS